MGTVVGGSCLCGAVRYEVYGPFLRAGHCHCSRCRKHSGAGMSTQGRVAREHFRLLRGEEMIETFRPQPNAAAKAFCRRCGSSMFGGTWPDGPEISIRFGSLDGDPGIRPGCHTFTDSAAPWDAITDDLPQHPGPLSGTTPSRE